MDKFVLTPQLVSKVLSVVDKGLSSGLGNPSPGNMCVEAAVCFAMGLPHGDKPTCVDPLIRSAKINLNDTNWSSKKARALGMRRLAVLQLGTRDIGFDQLEFAKKLALMTVKTILPIDLIARGLTDSATKCQNVTTLAEAEIAVRYSSRDIARRGAAGYILGNAWLSVRFAGYAVRGVSRKGIITDAVRSAKYASEVVSYGPGAERDKVLKTFATGMENILIEMQVPAVSFLSLITEE